MKCLPHCKVPWRCFSFNLVAFNFFFIFSVVVCLTCGDRACPWTWTVPHIIKDSLCSSIHYIIPHQKILYSKKMCETRWFPTYIAARIERKRKTMKSCSHFCIHISSIERKNIRAVNYERTQKSKDGGKCRGSARIWLTMAAAAAATTIAFAFMSKNAHQTCN